MQRNGGMVLLYGLALHRRDWHYIVEERHRNTTEGRRYSIGRHYIIEERHKSMTGGRHYSIGRRYNIEERHKNMIGGQHYSIGRHCIIEEQHENTTEGWYYSIGRHCSVRDWCHNVVDCPCFSMSLEGFTCLNPLQWVFCGSPQFIRGRCLDKTPFYWGINLRR